LILASPNPWDVDRVRPAQRSRSPLRRNGRDRIAIRCRLSGRADAGEDALQFKPVFVRTPSISKSVVPQRYFARALYSSAPHPLFFKAIQI
jgi:hypothetical protein